MGGCGAEFAQPDGYWIPETIIGSLAVLANGTVLFVMLFGQIKTSSTNIFIANLATVDFLTGAMIILFKALPNVDSPQNGSWLWLYCRLYCSELPLWFLINVSVMNLCLITLDRYLSVARPLYHKNYFSRNSSLALHVAIIWTLGLAVSSYNLFLWVIKSEDEDDGDDGDGAMCEVSRALPSWFWVATGFWTLFGMLLFPFMFMLVVYVHIYNILLQMPINIKGKRSQLRITVSCFMLLAVFLFCWLPDQTFFFMYSIQPLGIHLHLHSILYRAVVNLGFTNSFCNPFLYSFLNPTFKKAFRKLVFRCRACRTGSRNRPFNTHNDLTLSSLHTSADTVDQTSAQM
ncbi:octopamine receptor 1-like [Symsagittifera roscoffensis]|uniref:octopamine receptor 1-like n=1 Tax=Symsagittifera roscoffensis TaxID=84072 RepID=UPI00307BE51A